MRSPEQSPDWRNDRERRPSRLQYPDFLHPDHQSLQLTRGLRPSRFQYPDPTPEVRQEQPAINLVGIGFSDGLFSTAPIWQRSVVTYRFRQKILEVMDDTENANSLAEMQQTMNTGEAPIYQGPCVRWDDDSFLTTAGTGQPGGASGEYAIAYSVQRRSFATGVVLQEVNVTLSSTEDGFAAAYGIGSPDHQYPFYDASAGRMGVCLHDSSQSPDVYKKWTWQVGSNALSGTAATTARTITSLIRQGRLEQRRAKLYGIESRSGAGTDRLWEYDLTPGDADTIVETVVWNEPAEPILESGPLMPGSLENPVVIHQIRSSPTETTIYDVLTDTETYATGGSLLISFYLDAEKHLVNLGGLPVSDAGDWLRWNNAAADWETHFSRAELIAAQEWRIPPALSGLTVPEWATTIESELIQCPLTVGFLGSTPLQVPIAAGDVYQQLGSQTQWMLITPDSLLIPYEISDVTNQPVITRSAQPIRWMCAGDDRLVCALPDGLLSPGMRYITSQPVTPEPEPEPEPE
jgi:hypothetical protein